MTDRPSYERWLGMALCAAAMATVATAGMPVAPGSPGPGRFSSGKAVGSYSTTDATRCGQASAMASASAPPASACSSAVRGDAAGQPGEAGAPCRAAARADRRGPLSGRECGADDGEDLGSHDQCPDLRRRLDFR